MKELIKKYQILKNKPRLYALFKLLLWIPFFLLIIVLNYIGTKNVNLNQDTSQTQTTNKQQTTFTDMKQELLNTKLLVKYNINDYYIEGIIENNTFNGTFETTDNIQKIFIDSSDIYIVKKNEKIIDNSVFFDINKDYLLPQTLFNILSDYSSVTKIENDNKVFIYEVDDSKITINTQENKISQITIEEKEIDYELNFTYDL